MHVTRLREKLRDDPAAPRVVVTVRGKGYMFGEDG
jgi:DNA-binding response OmpR family regulator